MTPAIELRGVTKRFGSVVACDSVDLNLRVGEIHGLLGQNGAGKSTLMKIVIGLVPPDTAEIRIDGRSVSIKQPAEAAALGIGMVHQHFSLVDTLTVWENAVLAEAGRVDPRSAATTVQEVGDRYGLPVDPHRLVGDLSTSERQRVELIKALSTEPRVLILDEPTAVLSPAESRELFEVLARIVAEEHRTVVLISHKLDEILHATHRVTIMRDGQVVATLPTAESDAPTLAREMVGREVTLRAPHAAIGMIDHVEGSKDALPLPNTARRHSPARHEVALRISGASAVDGEGRRVLDGLSLEVELGEILGVAGVEGNGQAALEQLLSSMLPLTEGTVDVGGSIVKPGKAGAMRKAGIGLIPEDRHRTGCVLDMSVEENLVLTDVAQLRRRGLIDHRRLDARARELIDAFQIMTPSPKHPMWALSGGNQQRVVLARELSRSPRVLVASQPTRGLDVGAIEYISERLRAAAAGGIAVLLISAQLEEILDLADRIAVIYRGRIIGEMSGDAVDADRLALLMGGRAA